jgi:hypothetical protein
VWPRARAASTSRRVEYRELLRDRMASFIAAGSGGRRAA